MPMILQVQATPARATAEIEHPSAHKPHRRLLMPWPVLELREVAGRPARQGKIAVVALDNLCGWDAVQMVPDDPTVSILLFRQNDGAVYANVGWTQSGKLLP